MEVFTLVEMMPAALQQGLGLPVGSDAPLGFESQRLEFLTG